MTDAGLPVGQCVRCRFAQQQISAGGNQFWRCSRSDDGPEYPRYPRLPVVDCPGFAVAADLANDDADG